ncbi:MAG: hypothetical protein IJS84_08225 [Spirochaetales bacterium]|nr:hypothetical protein [Spirochaetales bacterium]MBQ7644995.1 hypothetical protein [Spirochaetales bacterium]
MKTAVDKRYVALTILLLPACLALFFLGVVFGPFLWVFSTVCMVAFIVRSIQIARAAYNDKSIGGSWFFFFR